MTGRYTSAATKKKMATGKRGRAQSDSGEQPATDTGEQKAGAAAKKAGAKEQTATSPAEPAKRRRIVPAAVQPAKGGKQPTSAATKTGPRQKQKPGRPKKSKDETPRASTSPAKGSHFDEPPNFDSALFYPDGE